MADYIGISKPLIVAGVTPKPEINYFYGPWESINEALNNIPQLARIRGLTVGIIEGSEIVEYWFKNGVNLVLKSVDPELVYTTDETQQIINGLGNTYVQKETGKVLIPTLLLQKLNGMVNIKTIGANLILTPLGELSAVAGGSSDYSSLSNKPSIGGIELTGNKSLATLGIQPAGAYITQTSLTNTLTSYLTKTEANNFYVAKEEGKRLITEEEADKLESAVTAGDLEPYSLKDTGVLEEVAEVTVEEEQKYIKIFDEAEGMEKKMSIPKFILSVSNPVYPTARTLVGEKNGKNDTFTTEYNYIAGSEKLNINGSVYYPNSGFYREGENLILSGAPIPEAGDFMFLEAIYLD